MVTTRRGSTTTEHQSAPRSPPAPKKAAAGKKHKEPEQTTDAKEEEQQPEKKKAKSTTSSTPRKAAATKKQAVPEEATDKPRDKEKQASVEEVEDGDGGKKKHAGEDTEMKDAVSVDKERGQKVEESPILEKGLVYFFLRGKVDVEHPGSLGEVKRSYMVLRPLPRGTKLVDGKVEDTGKNRLVAIPKKRLPGTTGYEKFLTFVEEPAATLEDLREKYLTGKTYQTKTVGERTDYPAQPIGEGVYAITKSENERQSHFVYMLTIPDKPNEIQEDFGLKEKGSFVITVRNPETPAPPSAGVPDPAEYPKEIMEEFGGLRWGAVQPKHLDFKHALVLFIAEKSVPQESDHEGTAEELNLLEEEDEKRVAHLKGDESVFTDLDLSRKDFIGLLTTWR